MGDFSFLTRALQFAWAAFVLALTLLAIDGINPDDWPIIKTALSTKIVTFSVAGFCIIMLEVFYAWRFHIDPVKAFDKIENGPMSAAVFLGLHAFGLCVLAGLIFSS